MRPYPCQAEGKIVRGDQRRPIAEVHPRCPALRADTVTAAHLGISGDRALVCLRHRSSVILPSVMKDAPESVE